jgi:hypothetical protein
MDGVVQFGIWTTVRFSVCSSRLPSYYGEPSADEDYSIFRWRQKGSTDPPTVYLKDPLEPLPSESSLRNPSFYLFHLPRGPSDTDTQPGELFSLLASAQVVQRNHSSRLRSASSAKSPSLM